MPGHGGSADIRADLPAGARLLTDVGGTGVYLGYSMGARFCLQAALLFPELVRSLVLVDSTGIPFEIAPGAHIENIAMPYGWRSFLLILARDLFRASEGERFADESLDALAGVERHGSNRER